MNVDESSLKIILLEPGRGLVPRPDGPWPTVIDSCRRYHRELGHHGHSREFAAVTNRIVALRFQQSHCALLRVALPPTETI